MEEKILNSEIVSFMKKNNNCMPKVLYLYESLFVDCLCLNIFDIYNNSFCYKGIEIKLNLNDEVKIVAE